MEPLVIPFEKLRMTDVEQVGGKNSSLGEMISQLADSGVRVPGGFATTALAYRDFLAQSGLDTDVLKDGLDHLAAHVADRRPRIGDRRLVEHMLHQDRLPRQQ